MSAADGIHKLGFRRWYERQLIECHAYLVTAFLSFVLVLACLEALNARDNASVSLLLKSLVLGGGCLGAVTLRRYLRMLAQAGRLAEKSVCGRCGTYGQLQVVGSPAMGAAPTQEWPDAGEHFDVECSRCGNRWTMSLIEPA
jgi:hypothetical protein